MFSLKCHAMASLYMDRPYGIAKIQSMGELFLCDEVAAVVKHFSADYEYAKGRSWDFLLFLGRKVINPPPIIHRIWPSFRELEPVLCRA